MKKIDNREEKGNFFRVFEEKLSRGKEITNQEFDLAFTLMYDGIHAVMKTTQHLTLQCSEEKQTFLQVEEKLRDYITKRIKQDKDAGEAICFKDGYKRVMENKLEKANRLVCLLTEWHQAQRSCWEVGQKLTCCLNEYLI